MSQTVQTITVAVIVAVAAVMLVRLLRKPSGGCEGCALKDNCNRSGRRRGHDCHR